MMGVLPACSRLVTVVAAVAAFGVTLAIPAAGEYVVRARGADGKRRPVEAAYRISASGGNTVAWPRFDSERMSRRRSRCVDS